MDEVGEEVVVVVGEDVSVSLELDALALVAIGVEKSTEASEALRFLEERESSFNVKGSDCLETSTALVGALLFGAGLTPSFAVTSSSEP